MKSIKDILLETAVLTAAVIAWGTVKMIHLYERRKAEQNAVGKE